MTYMAPHCLVRFWAALSWRPYGELSATNITAKAAKKVSYKGWGSQQAGNSSGSIISRTRSEVDLLCAFVSDAVRKQC